MGTGFSKAEDGTMKLSILIFLIMSFGVSDTGASDPADAELIFNRIRNHVDDVQTLSSEFFQEKHLSMLKSAAVSRGLFFFEKPDRMRWESITPERTGFAVIGEKGIKWRGNSDKKERFRLETDPVIKHFTDQIFAWVRADFSWLKEHYRISILSPKPAVILLYPITDQEKKILNRIQIFFSSDERSVRSVEIHETDGDVTRIRFSTPRINFPLSPELFQ
ncbi:MAG: outer membrane lipoprotein carrier protein LolA [Thermodesulfobacteriota bacterium]